MKAIREKMQFGPCSIKWDEKRPVKIRSPTQAKLIRESEPKMHEKIFGFAEKREREKLMKTPNRLRLILIHFHVAYSGCRRFSKVFLCIRKVERLSSRNSTRDYQKMNHLRGDSKLWISGLRDKVYTAESASCLRTEKVSRGALSNWTCDSAVYVERNFDLHSANPLTDYHTLY